MRLLRAITQALAVILGIMLFSYLIAFLAKLLDLDGMVVVDVIAFVGVLAIFTLLFYVNNDKKK